MKIRNTHIGPSLDRFLAPGSASVTLQTLTRAAHAIGRDCASSWCDTNGNFNLGQVDDS